MQVDLIPVEALTKEQYKSFSRLNLGDRGFMKFYLKSAYEQDAARLATRRNEIILSISENGKVISWVLLLDFRACSVCKWKRSVHVYTRSKNRGRGMANILIKQAIALSHPKKVYCRGNQKFFSRYGIKNG